MDQIRSDLQNNPKYLSEVIGVMDTSIKNLLAENSKLKEKLGDSQQDSLIELQDKIEMLNRRHFGNGKESLNKYRPIREKQRDLLPRNRSPLKEEVLNSSVRRELPEEEVIHEEASCPCFKGENIEEIEGLFE
jgi:hypothetical protein